MYVNNVIVNIVNRLMLEYVDINVEVIDLCSKWDIVNSILLNEV